MAFDAKDVAGKVASSGLAFVANILLGISTLTVWWWLDKFIPGFGRIKQIVNTYLGELLTFVFISQIISRLVTKLLTGFMNTISPDGLLGYPYMILISIDPSEEVLGKTLGFTYFILMSWVALLPLIRKAMLEFRGKKDETKEELTVWKAHKEAFKFLSTWKGLAWALLTLGVLQTAYILRLQYSTGFIGILTDFSFVENLNIGYWAIRLVVWMLIFTIGGVIGLIFGMLTGFGTSAIEQTAGTGVFGRAGAWILSKTTGTAEAAVQTGAGYLISNAGGVFISLVTFKVQPTLLTFGKGLDIFPESQLGYWLAFSLPLLKLVSGYFILKNHKALEKWSSPFTNWLDNTFKKTPGVEALGLVSKDKPGKEKIFLDEYKDYPHIETLITALKHGNDEQKNAAINTLVDLINNDKNIVRIIRMREALAKEYKEVTDANQLVVKLIIDLAKGEKK